MINNNKPPPFRGLNIRITIKIPINGRGFINQGSTLVSKPGTLLNLGVAQQNVMQSFLLIIPTIAAMVFWGFGA